MGYRKRMSLGGINGWLKKDVAMQAHGDVEYPLQTPDSYAYLPQVSSFVLEGRRTRRGASDPKFAPPGQHAADSSP